MTTVTLTNNMPPKPTSSTHKILVVDDESTIRLLVCNVLARMGYEYDTAEDGEIAMEKMQQTEFALVISDMKMPNIGGMELLEYGNKHFHNTDFLIVTGFAKDIGYVDVITAGAADFITKPFHLEELKAKIKRIFRERHYALHMEEQVWERTQELLVANDSLQQEVNDRKEAESNLRQERDKTAAEKMKLEAASHEISSLLRRSYFDTTIRFKNDNLLQCWETVGCGKRDCPAYGSKDLRCWLSVGTFCDNAGHKNISEKIRNCEKCPVYIHATADAIPAIGEQFNTLMAVLEFRAQELRHEKINAEQASLAKSEFLANMSHEIRTPLNGIVGMTELAMDCCVDERQKNFLHTINSEVNSLLVIINDILDFSKIEAGKLNLEEIPFDLQEIFDDLANAHALAADKKGLDFNSFVGPQTPTKLIGDPGRLRQILTNMVGNSLKFTEKGEIFITAELLEDSCDRVAIHFAVKDSGIGIPAEKQAAIFESFTQADGSTTRKFGGTGLGTTICKRLVEMMGGEIGVESYGYDGSTFWFDLAFGKQLIVDDGHDLEKDLAGVRVLLIEAKASCRMVVSAYLASWNCHTVEAATVDDALNVLRQSSGDTAGFDLILFSYDLHEADDGALLEEIIQVVECKAPPQIILLTAISSSLNTTSLKEKGIRWYLHKPVRQALLRDIMLRALGGDTGGTDAERGGVVKEATDMGFANEQPRILLAEDYPTNQKIAMMHFEGAGCLVKLAENGKRAVELFRQEGPDLVFMDIQMPEMDGYEATKSIRHLEGGLSRTPIIAMTAHATKADRDRCLAADMDDYISKPIRRKELLALVHKWYAGSGASGVSPEIDKDDNNLLPEEIDDKEVKEPIDFIAAMEEFMDDKELLIEVAETFVESARERVAKIEEAVSARDETTIKQEAHTLKGGALNMWAMKLADMAIAIEKAALLHDIGRCGEICSSFKVELSVLTEYIIDKAGE